MFPSISKLINSIVPADIACRVLEHLSSSSPRPSSFRLTSKSTSMESTLSSLHDELHSIRKASEGHHAHGHEARSSEGHVEVTHTFQSVPWFASAFTLSPHMDPHWIKHLRVVKEGRVYFQSLSSMLPALCLDVRPGMNVLDLCAAPGGKTTLISSFIHQAGGTGSLLAVEKDWVRMQRLEHNVRITSNTIDKVLDQPIIQAKGQPIVIGNVTLFHTDGRYLKAGPFDRILVDAPCSGSGRVAGILRDLPAPIDWAPEVIKRHVMRQKALVLNAAKNLKKGGTLIYSTCSLSQDENEEVVQWLLDHNHDLVLTDLTIDRGLLANRVESQGGTCCESSGGHLGVGGSSGGPRRLESGRIKLKEALLLITPQVPIATMGNQLLGEDMPSGTITPLAPPPSWTVISGVSRDSNLKAMDKTVRLLPSLSFEGFFIASIKKRG